MYLKKFLRAGKLIIAPDEERTYIEALVRTVNRDRYDRALVEFTFKSEKLNVFVPLQESAEIKQLESKFGKDAAVDEYAAYRGLKVDTSNNPLPAGCDFETYIDELQWLIRLEVYGYAKTDIFYGQNFKGADVEKYVQPNVIAPFTLVGKYTLLNGERGTGKTFALIASGVEYLKNTKNGLWIFGDSESRMKSNMSRIYTAADGNETLMRRLAFLNKARNFDYFSDNIFEVVESVGKKLDIESLHLSLDSSTRIVSNLNDMLQVEHYFNSVDNVRTSLLEMGIELTVISSHHFSKETAAHNDPQKMTAKGVSNWEERADQVVNCRRLYSNEDTVTGFFQTKINDNEMFEGSTAFAAGKIDKGVMKFIKNWEDVQKNYSKNRSGIKSDASANVKLAKVQVVVEGVIMSSDFPTDKEDRISWTEATKRTQDAKADDQKISRDFVKDVLGMCTVLNLLGVVQKDNGDIVGYYRKAEALDYKEVYDALQNAGQ